MKNILFLLTTIFLFTLSIGVKAVDLKEVKVSKEEVEVDESLNPGSIAIDFSLKDHLGKTVKLSDYKGKFIVLEWYNRGCPYVRKHYNSGNMQAVQNLYKANPIVKWISIISSTSNKQGHINSQEELLEQFYLDGFKADHLVRDLDGSVGRLYRAKTTPELIIINDKFKVAYRGAIDSIASSDKADIRKAKNYVTSGMSKLLLQKNPNPQKTKPYGCSIKY
jgi:hypothetical protein